MGIFPLCGLFKAGDSARSLDLPCRCNGNRNRHRLLWSNDGLIFVTYDHYETFLEIL